MFYVFERRSDAFPAAPPRFRLRRRHLSSPRRMPEMDMPDIVIFAFADSRHRIRRFFADLPAHDAERYFFSHFAMPPPRRPIFSP